MAQRFCDTASHLDAPFTDLECDLLEGAFFASRCAPLKFVYVSPNQRPHTGLLEHPNVVAVKHFDIHSDEELVIDGVLGRAEMRKRWFVLTGSAAEAVERLWRAMHMEESAPSRRKWLWWGPIEDKPNKFAEVNYAREMVRREVPLFCHDRAEQLVTWLEMMMEERP